MGINWSRESLPQAVGPIISPNYVPEDITKGDFAAATAVWGLTLVWGGICTWQSWGQTKQARNPVRSVYIWLVWLELLVSLIMGAECWIFMLRLIHPSFMFYFTICEFLPPLPFQVVLGAAANCPKCSGGVSRCNCCSRSLSTVSASFP